MKHINHNHSKTLCHKIAIHLTIVLTINYELIFLLFLIIKYISSVIIIESCMIDKCGDQKVVIVCFPKILAFQKMVHPSIHHRTIGGAYFWKTQLEFLTSRLKKKVETKKYSFLSVLEICLSRQWAVCLKDICDIIIYLVRYIYILNISAFLPLFYTQLFLTFEISLKIFGLSFVENSKIYLCLNIYVFVHISINRFSLNTEDIQIQIRITEIRILN